MNWVEKTKHLVDKALGYGADALRLAKSLGPLLAQL